MQKRSAPIKADARKKGRPQEKDLSALDAHLVSRLLDKRGIDTVLYSFFSLKVRPKAHAADRHKVEQAVRNDGRELQHAKDFQGNMHICVEAVKNNGHAIEFSSCVDKNLVLRAIQTNYPDAIWYASLADLEDKQFAFRCLRANPTLLNCFAEDAITYETAVLVVQQNGLLFGYLSERFRQDHNLLRIAIQENGDALSFAPKHFRDVPELATIALQTSREHTVYQSLSKRLKNTRSIILIAAQQNGRVLAHLRNTVWSADLEICHAAVRSFGRAIRYVNLPTADKLKLCATAVKQDWRALKFVMHLCKGDVDICKTAATQNSGALLAMTKQMREHPTVLAAALDGIASRQRLVEMSGVACTALH